jgi:RimJ/RimL family protein N-acetyltransferase
MTTSIIETPRLILRRWKDDDYQDMVEINQDPEVMKYFPSAQNEKQTRQLIENIEKHFEVYGFGLYAVEPRIVKQCIGFVGLNYTDFTAHFTPAFEIGWRLSKKYWRQGFATEAGREIIAKAFLNFNLDQIVSFTSKINIPSIRVMQKLGLQHDPKDDFINPEAPKNHVLSPHVLYRLTKENFLLCNTNKHS